MESYATAAELGAWLDPSKTDPAEAAAFAEQRATAGGIVSLSAALQRATELVEEHVYAGYAANPVTGLPYDEDVAAWLRDATCAQIEFWGIVSEQHDIAGVTTGTLSAGGVSHNMPQAFAPRARRILDLAGLSSPCGGWRRYRTPLELIGRTYP